MWLMKKLIILNLLFCIFLIIVSTYYFNTKSKKAVVYHYAENYIEKNYSVDRENLTAVQIEYRMGMGLYEIEVKDLVTKKYYLFEVDIRNDYSLIYINDLTNLHNKNKAEQVFKHKS